MVSTSAQTLILACCLIFPVSPRLYPRESETREIKSLNGIWTFRTSPAGEQQNTGFRDRWFTKPLASTGEAIPMPVPSSFNDITQNRTIRDYIGWVWYQTEFFVPQRWESTDTHVILDLGSVHYFAHVFLGDVRVASHEGGHLPFSVDVTEYLNYTSINRLTVAVNNTLTKQTIPQGQVTYKDNPARYPPGFAVQSLNFDFFNYAGIHRSVVLYSVPAIHIQDVTIVTDISGDDGVVSYTLKYEGTLDENEVRDAATISCMVEVYDKQRQLVAWQKGCEGKVVIKGVSLWWPITTHPDPGYLYTMKTMLVKENLTIDVYYQRFGVRKIQVTPSSFLINGKPFYFMGFGKHEDTNIRGKGLDLPLIVKDFNLIEWIGANSFRTSHYPYSEELMDHADERGVVVIDECPAVGLDSFGSSLLQRHMAVLTELVARDKNRPSVVMWSVANEPKSTKPEAQKYFSKLASLVKRLDPTRPVTAALNADCSKDQAGRSLDVVMMNRYYAWYSDTGYPQVISRQVVDEFTNCHAIYNKPMMISEYGADAVHGLHQDPTFVFTEDYQAELLLQNHRGFDTLREKGFFIGEHVWNFADFMTAQTVGRVVGNRKGLFTRERQPKASARIIRCRYHHLQVDNGTKIRAHLEDEEDLMYCPSMISSCTKGMNEIIL